jgi:hypothetical protein
MCFIYNTYTLFLVQQHHPQRSTCLRPFVPIDFVSNTEMYEICYSCPRDLKTEKYEEICYSCPIHLQKISHKDDVVNTNMNTHLKPTLRYCHRLYVESTKSTPQNCEARLHPQSLMAIFDRLCEYKKTDKHTIFDQYTFEIMETSTKTILIMRHIDILRPKHHFRISITPPKRTCFGSIRVQAVDNNDGIIIHPPRTQWYYESSSTRRIHFKVSSLFRYMTHIDALYYYG